MTPRDRVIRTLNHHSVDRAPRDLWPLPGIETDHAEEMAEIEVRFPSDILQLDTKFLAGKRTKGVAHRAEHYTDAWGCTWQLGPRGAVGPLVEAPLADAAKIPDYGPPAELLEAARFSRANKSCEGALRFVLAWSEVRPLDRLQWLRGSEPALAGLAAGDEASGGLLARLHDLFRREVELWALTGVDGVAFRDDLGSSGGLRVSLKTWRNVLKPLYREYCDILHARDKFVFFHSQGQIAEIFADLIEIGIDAIHAEWRLMDFEKLAEKYRGRITFWGETELQRAESPCSVQEVREAVLCIRRALDFGGGGAIAQCSWAPGTSIRNVVAFFEEWMVPLPVNI